MDRRKFISVSGISLVGLNGIVSTSTLFLPKENQKDASDFMELIGAQKLNKKLSDSQNNYILKCSESWMNLGYKNDDYGPIWKAGNKTFIYPLQLSSDLSDNIDQVVLVFTILKDGELKYTGSLSGFHLEIIDINKKLLLQLGDAHIIRSCILPAEGRGKPLEGGWAFKTEKGFFELSSNIEKDKSYISSALTVDQKYIWQNSILSNHSLNIKSQSLA